MFSHKVFTIVRLQLVVCLVVSLLFHSAQAATASRVGGSGMSWMRTSDTLSSNELVVYDQFGIDTYVILNSNLTDYDLFNSIGVNYGLFDRLELGYQSIYLSNDRHKASGFRSHKGIVKFRILGDIVEDNYAVTLSGFKTFSPAAKDKLIGSGVAESGAEVNMGYFGDDINLHLTLGSATADAKYYAPDVVYFSVDKQYANLGAEFMVSDKFTLGVEGIKEQSQNVDFDENTLFALSLQYRRNKLWSFDFGAAFGVPEDRSEPVKSFYASVNYRIGGQDTPVRQKHTVAPVKTAPRQQVIPVPDTKPAAKPAFSQRPASKPKQKQKRKQVSANYRFMVKLKNASGSKSAASRVADFLKKNGYGVASIQSITRRDKTEIRYLNSNSKQALQLAIKLPGSQDLRRMTKLGKGIDFEIIIGSDIVRNLR